MPRPDSPRERAADPAPRRSFLRRLAGGALAAVALSSGAARAAARPLHITPGTLVDARGRRVRSTGGADPYIGEIILAGFNFAPTRYAPCQGQILSIAQNTALFSLLGTTYGGNGQTTFGLPDLRGRSAVGAGQGPGLSLVFLGETGGSSTATLAVTQMPAHTHTPGTLAASTTAGTTADPTGAVLARPSSDIPAYVGTAPTGTLAAGTLAGSTGSAGGSQPFSNDDPYLGLTYAIALQGIFPPRP